MLAKLTRPKVHRALPRERLFKCMDDSLERPLLWIVAPPGSGKTTLVASYLEARKLSSVWYQLDAGDSDVGTFFYYLAQSLPQSRSKRAEQLPLLTPEQLGDLPAFYRHFCRAFFARLRAPALLVLDNYHEVDQGSALHSALEHAIQEVPEGINVVVMSRSQPPRNMVRLKLGERLHRIDWSQLRMTLDETRAIAAARIGADEQTARRIFQISDGWAAGIALTVQRDLASEGDHGEDHEVKSELFDYFAAQVLSTAPLEIQHFLKRTALLPDMTAETAASISGCRDCETLLEELYRRGIFIDRRNTRPPTYHYHDLFREFLLAQLELSKDEFQRLRLIAATLLERTGRHDEAIRLYLTAGEWLAAKRLLIAAAPALVGQGRGSSLREWFGALPREMWADDPWVGYWFAATMTRATPAQARPYLERAFEAFARRGDIRAQRMLCAEIMLTYMHEFACLAPLDPWLERLSRLLEVAEPFPSAAAELPARTACLFALDFRQPEPARLAACSARLEELLEEDVPADLAGMAGGILVMHLYVMADLAACARVAARVRKMLEMAKPSPVGQGLGWVQLGHATLRGGDASEAQRCFNRALQVGAQNAVTLPTVYVYSYLGLAFCALERGDLTAAQQYRRKFEEYWVPSRKIDGTAALRVQLWTECHRGHWDAALGLARRHRDAAQDSGVFMLIFESTVLFAIVCAQNNLADECHAALEQVRAKLVGTAYAHFTYLADLVEAYQALLNGDRATCHARLRSGFTLSQRDQGMFLLRMQPIMLPALAAEALFSQIEADYVTDMIRRFALPAPSSSDERWPWRLRIFTLGRFEVLREGQPLEFSRKAPKKTLALLKALIALGGRNVREQLLLDTFWPDEEGDVANRSLTAALHRLRALVGDNAVLQQGGRLSLDAQQVWVDVWAFEVLSARTAGPAGPVAMEPLLSLYRGGFLPDDEGEPWSVTLRERLRGKFIHLVSNLAGGLERAGCWEKAIECYLRGLDADPAIEQFYQGLMRCYARLDRVSEAIAAYQRLKRMLSVLLAIKPSATTEKLYQSLR